MRRRTFAGIAAGGAVAVLGTAAGAAWMTAPAGADSVGAVWSELSGERSTTTFAAAADAPRRVVPAWTRDVGTDLVVVRPGSANDSVDADAVRVDMAVPSGTSLPVSCEDVPTGIPWDGGGSWPDLGPAKDCNGWAVAFKDGRLYLWRD